MEIAGGGSTKIHNDLVFEQDKCRKNSLNSNIIFLPSNVSYQGRCALSNQNKAEGSLDPEQVKLYSTFTPHFDHKLLSAK